MRLLRTHVSSIVGEEDEAAIHIDGDGPFRAAEIEAPAALVPLIVRLRERMDVLSASLGTHEELKGLTAFVDPIDGTKEFCSGLGEQCSICVGLADAAGAAVGGLVYRPLCAQRSWALGCRREGVRLGALRTLAPPPGSRPDAGAFLCSNGGTSAFCQALQAEMGYVAYPAGGAGNKALLLLELPRAVYIQDRGVSRWDTCAAQAVVEAHGGRMGRLDAVVAEGGGAGGVATPSTYTYLKGTQANSVFVAGLARLTKYNARAGVETGGLGTSADQFKPYANVCGLFAVPPGVDELAIVDASRRVAQSVPPSYD